MLEEVAALWRQHGRMNDRGLIYLRRTVVERKESPRLVGLGVNDLVEEFQCRCRAAQATSAAAKHRVRDEILRDAGGLDYDMINNQFRLVAKQLSWPPAATLKAFRHLFATAMANGGMPEHERRYLMGHSSGRGSISLYTHMNQLAEHYRAIAETQWARVLEVIRERLRQWKSASEGEGRPHCAPPG